MDMMTSEEVEELFNEGGGNEEEIMEHVYETTTAATKVARAPAQPAAGPPSPPSNRPEAVSAAFPFTFAFEVAPVDGTESSKIEQQSNELPQLHGIPRERCCLGHKGTIFGVSFSECGNFLATASQDSTVCIWNVKTHALLSTLKGHSQDHECLRVAWASTSWEAERLKRRKESSASANSDVTNTGSGSSSYMLATGGADGFVKVWVSSDPYERNSWSCVSSMDHSSFFQRRGRDELDDETDDDEDGLDREERRRRRQEEDAEAPQIYALQFIDHWQGLPTGSGVSQNSFLMSSSDDYLHLWELDDDNNEEGAGSATSPQSIKFREVMSLRFTSMQHPGYGVVVGRVTSSGLKIPSHSIGKPTTTEQLEEQQRQYHFGGDRNPDHLIFVFDAAYCSGNGLVGVALSDGSLRLMNGRGICLLVLQLPGCQSHLTALGWDSTGTRLATCVATGHVILWGLQQVQDPNHISAHCQAILEGGHELGRPLYGAKYCGGVGASQELLLSWGVDGRLVLWDSRSQGQVRAPLAILKSYNDSTNVVGNNQYPLYAVDVNGKNVVVGGGGNEGGLLGIPAYLYDLCSVTSEGQSKVV